MIGLLSVLKLRFDLFSQLLGAVCVFRRDHHVENDVYMMRPGNHAEIMEGQARVDRMQD